MVLRASAADQRPSPGPAVFPEVPFTLTTEEAAMRARLVIVGLTLAAAAVVTVGSCKDDVGLTSVPPPPERFVAFLSGANEPTAIATAAQGLATLTINGNLVSYRVELSNIDSAFLAHVHHGVAGVNRPGRVDLFNPPRPSEGLAFSGGMVADTIPVAGFVLAF